MCVWSKLLLTVTYYKYLPTLLIYVHDDHDDGDDGDDDNELFLGKLGVD